MKKHNKHKNYCTAIIAGAGDLPFLLISHLRQSQRIFVVLCLEGNASYELAKDTNHIFIGLGEIGKALAFLKQNKVKEIVFAGKVKRPSLGSIKLDVKGLSFLGKLGIEIFKGGDNKILSHIVNLLEDQGFKVIGPENLIPELVAHLGVLGKTKPSKQDYKDISVGKEILAALGASDVGQAVIVEDGYVLGIEAAEGTDNLISRCGKLKKEEKRVGVLIKMKKVDQETRIDLPGIGTRTLLKIHKAGFKGIAVESGGSLIINIDAVIKKANELKLFLIGID
jgi:UDP-2,3-diacylglucosamine hydrolase